jgi:hypothetical protein
VRLRSAVLAATLAAGLALAGVPSPQSYFGHPMGADRKVLDWDKVVGYFRALAQSSDRIAVREIGKSTEGRPFVVATLADAATLRSLDRYRWIQQKLADPRRTLPEEAEKLIAEGKVVVLVTCSIHANEIASTHSAVEFAYRLLTEDTPKLRAIRENAIFLLVPSLNPDGLDLVTRWYRRTLGTPFEGTAPPELYQKYVGHDNNRDWYMFTQAETRLAVSGIHNVWHPQIVYDLHQMGANGARMFVPPWMDPIEPNIDPILVQECNLIGMGMATDLTAAGKTGVLVNGLYDFWTPGRHYQAYHGGLRILSETASARLASPIVVRPGELDGGPGFQPRESSWNYLEPWKGGAWRLRDIVDYQLIAMESCLFQAATRRQDFLRNFYRVGLRAVERARPYAFVVPAVQRDPGATRKLLRTLAFGQVEILRARRPFTGGGKRYPAASYVIRMAQPYNSFAKTLLERQRYPDLRQYMGGPPRRPYDVTAHTLPLLMGVDVDTVNQPFEADLVPVTQFTGEPTLSGADTGAWRLVNRAWRAGREVWRDMTTGDFATSPAPGRKLLRRPRIGLYQGFVPNMDEGWTRWLLEQFGFAYSSVGNREIRAGRLHYHYDVLVFADQRADSIAAGHRAGSMPEEFCGGLAEEGAEALRQFARDGGTLIFFNRSFEYATRELGVQTRNVLDGHSNREFYSPGSLLTVSLDTAHPLALGLPREITVWNEGSPAWETQGGAVARYPASGILASGWLLGEEYLAGKAALLEVPFGAGRAILFGMRPQYRGQSYQTFKLFFNALVR